MLQLRSSLKMDQARQSIRYKAHESLSARVTTRRTGQPCKNGSLVYSNINKWMDEFILGESNFGEYEVVNPVLVDMK